MSNTFVNITVYKNAKSYFNRIKHNGRATSFDKREMKNIVVKDMSSFYELTAQKAQKQKLPSKSELSDIIAKLVYRQKKAKKENTKQRLQVKIDSLTAQREATVSRRDTAKANFIEMVFTITDVDKKLKHDKAYAKDLYRVIKAYIKKRFPNLDINMLSLHLDQSNPHLHVNGLYDGEKTLTKDLQESFKSDKKQYSQLQHDFNAYIRNHQIIKKYTIDVEHTVKGGRKDYMKLHAYKSLQVRMKKIAKKQVESYLKKTRKNHTFLGISNKNAIIEALQNQLTQKFTELKATQNISKKVEEIILKEEKLDRLTQQLIDERKHHQKKENEFDKKLEKMTIAKELIELEAETLEKELELSRKKERQLKTALDEKVYELRRLRRGDISQDHSFGSR